MVVIYFLRTSFVSANIAFNFYHVNSIHYVLDRPSSNVVFTTMFMLGFFIIFYKRTRLPAGTLFVFVGKYQTSEMIFFLPSHVASESTGRVNYNTIIRISYRTKIKRTNPNGRLTFFNGKVFVATIVFDVRNSMLITQRAHSRMVRLSWIRTR